MTSANDNLLNVAIIGTGMVAATHLRALADLSDTINLKGVLSRRVANAEKFASEALALFGQSIEVYSSLDNLSQDSDLDFAIVLTPPNARTGIVSKLAHAGIHMLMEKPIERSSEAASDIVAMCEQHNVKLGIVFQHRMRSASKKLAQLISGNSLGDLCIAEVVVPWWREQSYYDEPGRGTYERDGGGVLISQAIHSLDLMLSFTGPVSQVQAMASTSGLHQMESEDYVTAGLRFANGAIGSLIASTASYPGDAEYLTLHYRNAVVNVQSGELSVRWRNGDVEHFGESAATGGGADPMAFTHDWHRDIIDDFANAIRDQRQPAITGRSALQVHRLIDALITSSSSQTTINVDNQRSIK